MNIGKDKEYLLAGNPCAAGREGMTSILEVTVSYSKGGANFFQGTQEKRGYWLHVSPVGIEKADGYNVKSFTIGAGPKGYKAFLLEVKRRTPKADAEALRLAALKERDLIEKVLAAGGLALAEGVELPPVVAPEALPALPSGTMSHDEVRAAGKPSTPAPISARQCWMTAEERARLPALGATQNDENPLAQIKYFDPSGSWTWYGIEYDAAEERFFGYVVGTEPELGYFTLPELREIRGRMGLGVERDRHFRPTPLSELRARAEGAAGHAR